MPTTTTPQVHFRTVDGVRIRYADSGGSQEPTVLLTSPWPESVYAFAPIWSTLAEHARLFAVDLPGFGASERRDNLLSPRAMGEFLAELIAEVDLGRPHIVGPDVGTSATLFGLRHIRSGSPARSSAPAELRSRSSSANRSRRGCSTRTSTSPPDGRAGDRRRGGGHDRGRRPGRHPRGLPRLLRRGPLRRVDALCPPISAGAARACRAAAADRHAGHDHQRP